MPLNQGLANKRSLNIKGKKVRLIYVLISNVIRLEKLKLFVIKKAHKSKSF
jgi:hypothetical protein